MYVGFVRNCPGVGHGDSLNIYKKVANAKNKNIFINYGDMVP